MKMIFFCIKEKSHAIFLFFFLFWSCFYLNIFKTNNLNSIPSNWTQIQYWDFVIYLELSKIWKEKKILIQNITNIKWNDEMKKNSLVTKKQHLYWILPSIVNHHITIIITIIVNSESWFSFIYI
jgi:hypothetical protein